VVAQLRPAELEALLYDWRSWARPEQLLPAGDWDTWVALAGRGWGKTRAGAEAIREAVEKGGARRVALVARTAADVRDVMIEGESGLLAISPPSFRPIYEPSKRRLTWPNGAIATTFTSEKPDQLRGPQHDFAWCDELAAWRYPDAWAQLQAGLRLGRAPRAVVTTTPRPTRLLKEILAERGTVKTGGSTLENRANLARKFIARVEAAAGGRFARQEFWAELLSDVEGALWSLAQIEARVVRPAFRAVGDGDEIDYAPVLPEFVRVVVGVDPATKADPKKDEPGETGIVVCGLAADGLAYVLEDGSGVYKPKEWADKTAELFERYSADRVIAEDNQGGDLVESNLRASKVSLPLKRVHASVGKKVRAEPVSAFYETQLGYPLGRVRHLGHHAELETQMTTWVPTSGARSPDRLDALVWALTELLGTPDATYTRHARGKSTR